MLKTWHIMITIKATVKLNKYVFNEKLEVLNLNVWRGKLKTYVSSVIRVHHSCTDESSLDLNTLFWYMYM